MKAKAKAKAAPKGRRAPNGSNGSNGSSNKRHRIAHQITLSPESTAILKRWVDRAGDGTKSIHVDMAIRYADRKKIFEGDLFGAGPDIAADKPASLDEAIAQHLPTLISRLAETALKKAE